MMSMPQHLKAGRDMKVMVKLARTLRSQHAPKSIEYLRLLAVESRVNRARSAFEQQMFLDYDQKYFPEANDLVYYGHF